MSQNDIIHTRLSLKLLIMRKHKYPVQRSAFTHCDDELPSRIDFAKERYGGYFTAEQVEDVKTLRIPLVFVLDVPMTTFISFLFGIHVIGKQSSTVNHSCSASRFILLTNGGLINLVSAIILPVYVYSPFLADVLQESSLNSFLPLSYICWLAMKLLVCFVLIWSGTTLLAIVVCACLLALYISATSPSTTLGRITTSRSACWNQPVFGHSDISSKSFFYEGTFDWSLLWYQSFIPTGQLHSCNTIFI